MLNKSICMECHMARLGLIQSYPKIENSEFQNEFNLDWNQDIIWCYGIEDAMSDENLKKSQQDFDFEKKNNPFLLSPSKDHFPKSCLLKEKYLEENEI